MAEAVDELIDIFRDSSKSKSERIEAVKKLYFLYKRGEPLPAFITIIARTDIDELKELIDRKVYASDEEEILLKGIFEAKKENIKDRLSGMTITELAELYIEPKSKVEYEIVEELLSGREEELEKKAKAIAAAAEIIKAKAITEHLKFIKKATPKVESPTDLGFLSDLQVESVDTPSKWYAKEAFMNGLWNMKWGEPKKYGINIERMASYVSRPRNKDFAMLMYSSGIWHVRWGNPEDYGIFE